MYRAVTISFEENVPREANCSISTLRLARLYIYDVTQSNSLLKLDQVQATDY
jgi:hypothetical protein